jgi:hypothetical protein
VAATGPVFLGAALAVGWTVAEILSVSLNSSRIAERLVRAAPLCVAEGLSLAAVTQERDAPWKVVGLWAIALCIAGCGVAMAWTHVSAKLMRTVDALEGGVAMAWPHLSAWLMRTVDALEGGVAMAWPHLSAWLMRTVDALEGGAAGAAINVVQSTSGAFGACLAGVVDLTTGGELAAAHWLFAGFAVTAIGMIGSFRTV